MKPRDMFAAQWNGTMMLSDMTLRSLGALSERDDETFAVQHANSKTFLLLLVIIPICGLDAMTLTKLRIGRCSWRTAISEEGKIVLTVAYPARYNAARKWFGSETTKIKRGLPQGR
ncbi:unnamed protein product [Gongylonema pulchrum]|uniref:PH domain-containing protein n=1 Tax=Gongylonema pulchrum TaxID=637853 RepID=A0A183E982_9BILA|nr:unnamed protein product [Gongylonema pulchrum]